MTMLEGEVQLPSERLAGTGRRVYVAGVIALTEPGPAASGLVVVDERGRLLARRAAYLGPATEREATARALLAGFRLALTSRLESPVFFVEDRSLAIALEPGRADESAASEIPLYETLREVADELGTYQIGVVAPSANPAHNVALTPLIDWLPERTRRAERLSIRPIGDHVYEVESESQPGQVYKVHLPPPGSGVEAGPIRCECPDFTYRGIPCKHLLIVARETGEVDRLFYPEIGGPTVPSGPEDIQ